MFGPFKTKLSILLIAESRGQTRTLEAQYDLSPGEYMDEARVNKAIQDCVVAAQDALGPSNESLSDEDSWKVRPATRNEFENYVISERLGGLSTQHSACESSALMDC